MTILYKKEISNEWKIKVFMFVCLFDGFNNMMNICKWNMIISKTLPLIWITWQKN